MYSLAEYPIDAHGVRISVKNNEGVDCGHVFLYILKNDLHTQPFGFAEDLFVEENVRAQGLGKMLMRRLIEVAKEKECYKLIGTSRHTRTEVHAWYERLGFTSHGIEFRMDLMDTHTTI